MITQRLHRTRCMTLLAAFLLLTPTILWALEDADCAGCHSDAEMVGETFAIDLQTFDHTAHAELGCSSCHPTVSDDHPDDGLSPAKASCHECHDDVSTEAAGSRHADNAACADCHNPHRVHGPTAVSGHDMNRTCATCHERPEMQAMHMEWLPQADLHIDMLPCITCHSAAEDYVVSLYIIRRESGKRFGKFELATYDELQQLSGDSPIQELVDSNADGYISLAELKLFNLDPAKKQLRLQGMMTPEQVSHDFKTHDNRWDCSSCHASGPEAMQVSYLSLPDDKGSFNRLAVEKGAVLDALYGTPDFYMVGSTRSKALNYAGLLILAGGMVMPVGHGTLRFLTRKNRSKNKED